MNYLDQTMKHYVPQDIVKNNRTITQEALSGGSVIKNQSASTGHMSLIPGLRGSLGEGNSNPLW